MGACKLFRFVVLLSVLVTFLGTPSVHTDDKPFWPKYVPEAERPAILKKAYKRVRVTDAALADAAMDMIWVTEPVARVVVSHLIDKGGYDKESADANYGTWRDRGEYYVCIRESLLPGWPRTTQDGHLLKRVGGDGVYSIGYYLGGGDLFDSGVQVSDRDRSHFIKLRKLTVARERVIRSLDEIVEVSVATESDGYVTARFVVRDLVDKLEDL